MTQRTEKFVAKYFYRAIRKDWWPFTPDIISINDHHIEYKKRNPYFISCDTITFHFQNVIGIDVNKGLFGATITIKSNIGRNLKVVGFSKRDANQIRELCNRYISKNTQRGTTEALSDAIYNAIDQNKSRIGIADEMLKLKSLLDQNIISQEEYDEQKERLLRYH